MSTVDDIKLLPKSILKNELATTQGKLWEMFSTEYDALETALRFDGDMPDGIE